MSVPNPRVWEFLTASLEEKNSKRNRELENFANLEPRVCEDLVQQDLTQSNQISCTVWLVDSMHFKFRISRKKWPWFKEC